MDCCSCILGDDSRDHHTEPYRERWHHFPHHSETYMYIQAGINMGLSMVSSLGGGNQIGSSTAVLFYMNTLENLWRGSQPQGVGNPCAPHPLKFNKSYKYNIPVPVHVPLIHLHVHVHVTECSTLFLVQLLSGTKLQVCGKMHAYRLNF